MTTSQKVYFSPTGTTFKVLKAIESGIGYKIEASVNLTKETRENNISNLEKISTKINGDLLLIGVPVYGSRIPSFIRPILEDLKGDGRWVIAVVVYGNVKPGKSLDELTGVLKKQGFKILAAANFIGEHSYSHDKLLLGKDRPNVSDLSIATQFGIQISSKLENNPKEITLSDEVIPARIDFSEKGGSKFVEFSEIDKDICAHWTNDCNICYNSCPMKAIDVDTMAINHDLCISCFACVRACPNNARKIVFKTPEFLKKFNSFIEPKKEPQLFLNSLN